MSWSSKISLPVSFFNENFALISEFPVRVTGPTHLTLLNFLNTVRFYEHNRLWSPSFCKFFPDHLTSDVGTKYCAQKTVLRRAWRMLSFYLEILLLQYVWRWGINLWGFIERSCAQRSGGGSWTRRTARTRIVHHAHGNSWIKWMRTAMEFPPQCVKYIFIYLNFYTVLV